MTEINIAGAIDKLMIFDDPEYCANSDIGYCRELYRIDSIYYCHRFVRHGDEENFIKCVSDEFKERWVPIKCDQCKEAYRKIKQSPNASEMYDFCHDCNKELYGWFKNCPNCGEKLTGYANKKISFANKFKELLKQE